MLCVISLPCCPISPHSIRAIMAIFIPNWFICWLSSFLPALCLVKYVYFWIYCTKIECNYSAKWLFEPLSLYKNTEVQFWTVCKILRRCKGLLLWRTSKILGQIQDLHWHATLIWWPKSNEPAFLCSEDLCNRQFINPFLLSGCFTVLMMFECSIYLVHLKKKK